MTGRGMSLPLDSFEVVPTADGFVLGKSSERPCFLRQWNLTVIFSRSAVRGLFLFTIHWKLLLTIFIYDHRGFFRVPIRQESVYVRYCFCCTGELEEGIGAGKPGVTGISGCCFPVLSVNSGSERFRDNRILLREIIVILIICIVFVSTFPVMLF